MNVPLSLQLQPTIDLRFGPVARLMLPRRIFQAHTLPVLILISKMRVIPEANVLTIAAQSGLRNAPM